MKFLTRTIWLLSLVSLFTDLASEMLYPVMPLYLRSIGFSIVFIGVLEGLAEAVAGLSKGYFGQWSDRLGRRRPFVQWGYGLSALSKPLLAVLAAPWWVFLVRALDRLGKGLRTGARDALLADEAPAAQRGAVFGFHRALDTLGAVLGPAAALLWLSHYPGQYRLLFVLAFGPGLLAVVITLLVREKPQPPSGQPIRPFWASFAYWRRAPASYRRIAGALLLFAVFNSSDTLLLLLARQQGLSDQAVIGVYIFYNLVYAATALPAGLLADRLGPARVLTGGLLLFALVYGGATQVHSWLAFGILFGLYGLYAAATEGVGKAWLSQLCAPTDKGAALGTFAGLSSLAALGASTLTGLLWQTLGAPVAFGLSAAVAGGVALFLGAAARSHSA
ncbi:MFS transporter [Hymenobacter chitinivorans]|uniref:Putative MFS family arabinose efflux permease n=1 Tax=Hymenobacter chitinivorans DSM 11115 TaxID=1121954 RepID=A0A2M9BLW7_9BACT|nr:MFS transporter [Hymenobacter chitinivorans]PJJ58922.1 putative MFS family arabinose efflux permease [Hymenobacter chitinivorans DSM 11115]